MRDTWKCAPSVIRNILIWTFTDQYGRTKHTHTSVLGFTIHIHGLSDCFSIFNFLVNVLSHYYYFFLMHQYQLFWLYFVRYHLNKLYSTFRCLNSSVNTEGTSEYFVFCFFFLIRFFLGLEICFDILPFLITCLYFSVRLCDVCLTIQARIFIYPPHFFLSCVVESLWKSPMKHFCVCALSLGATGVTSSTGNCFGWLLSWYFVSTVQCKPKCLQTDSSESTIWIAFCSDYVHF